MVEGSALLKSIVWPSGRNFVNSYGNEDSLIYRIEIKELVGN
jgi:hypothetical protein